MIPTHLATLLSVSRGTTERRSRVLAGYGLPILIKAVSYGSPAAISFSLMQKLEKDTDCKRAYAWFSKSPTSSHNLPASKLSRINNDACVKWSFHQQRLYLQDRTANILDKSNKLTVMSSDKYLILVSCKSTIFRTQMYLCSDTSFQTYYFEKKKKKYIKTSTHKSIRNCKSDSCMIRCHLSMVAKMAWWVASAEA